MQSLGKVLFSAGLLLLFHIKVSCGLRTPILFSTPVPISTEVNFIRCLKPDLYRPGIILVCASFAVMEFNITSGEYSIIAGAYFGRSSTTKFNYVSDLVQRDQDTLIVSDLWNHCLRWIKSGNTSLLAGHCGNKGNQDGTFLSARFEQPHSMILNENNMYVLNGYRLAIRLVNFLTEKVSTLITENVFSPSEMVCRTPQCNYIYATFQTGVIVYNRTSNTTHLLAGSYETFGDSTGSFNNTRFNSPTSLMFLRDDTLLVADSSNHRIVMLNLNESIRTSHLVEKLNPRDQPNQYRFIHGMLCYNGSVYIGTQKMRRTDGIFKSEIIGKPADLICYYPHSSGLNTPTTMSTTTPTTMQTTTPIPSSSSLCTIIHSILLFPSVICLSL